MKSRIQNKTCVASRCGFTVQALRRTQSRCVIALRSERVACVLYVAKRRRDSYICRCVSRQHRWTCSESNASTHATRHYAVRGTCSWLVKESDDLVISIQLASHSTSLRCRQAQGTAQCRCTSLQLSRPFHTALSVPGDSIALSQSHTSWGPIPVQVLFCPALHAQLWIAEKIERPSAKPVLRAVSNVHHHSI